MEHSASSTNFYDDDVVDDNNDNNNNDQDSTNDDEDDIDDDFIVADGSPTADLSSAAHHPNNNKKKNQRLLPTYVFCGDNTEAMMPKSRTVEMKRRENDWFIVVYRDLESLVQKFKITNNGNNSSGASNTVSSHGNYTVIDGTTFADSDALQIRLKRDCALLLTAMKGNHGDQFFTPVAVEMINSVLMPFVLSEELLFGCRSTWNHVVTCLKSVIRRMRVPPKNYSPSALYVENPPPSNNNNNTSPVDLPPSEESTATNNNNNSNNLLLETGLNLEWRPLAALLQKVIAAAIIPGHSQVHGFVLGLFLAYLRCVPSGALTELWAFTRRHFIGHITTSNAVNLIPSRILGRQAGAVDTDSIKEQCATLREMLEWTAAAWKVPHPIAASEEIFQRLANTILQPVGVRLIEKNKQAFDDHVVPLRNRVMELIGEHLRVNLGARRTSDGNVSLTSGWAVNLLSLLLVRDEAIAWDELVRWRRVLEPACSPKSGNSVPLRYLSDLINSVSKYTQKRINLLRARKPMPAADVIAEVFPALEGDQLQKFLSLTVPLVADTAFNPRSFTTYSFTMWVLNFLDPTPATAARSLASVQVGFSDAGKETKQVTQALKILSEQLCAMSSQTSFLISTSNDENNSVNGKMWKEILPSNYATSFLGIPSEDAAPAAVVGNNTSYILPTHTSPGALQTAAKEILADAKCPFDCVKKMSSVFFYQALENLESTVEDRVNDAFRCIYSLVIFGQCDHLPSAQRKELVRAFVSKIEEKYFPVEAYLSSTTAGLLHFAFTAVFRLVADDTAETLRVVEQIRDMLSKPSIHETLSTCLRTLFAAILEQGSIFLFSRITQDIPPISYLADLQKNTHHLQQQQQQNNNSSRKVDPESIHDIRKNHPDLLQWFCPLIQQIFDAAQVEVANGLTTTSRFVGNVFAICTLLEHLPAPVMTQLALERTKKFVQYLVDWCQEKASDAASISEKAEANFRCVSSSIQSILDVAQRSLLKPLPYDAVQITIGADVWRPSRQITRYIEPTVADQRAVRGWIGELLVEARRQLSLISPEAGVLERALRSEIAGRIIGGSRTGCWAFNGMSSVKIKALDDEIAKSSSVVARFNDKNNNNNKNNTNSSVSNNNVNQDSALTTENENSNDGHEPSQESAWWMARFYDIDQIYDENLIAPTLGCNPNQPRDSTDLDTESYLWLIQEMLTKYCSVPSNTNNNNEDSAVAASTTTNNNNNNKRITTPVTGIPQGQLFEDHPLFQIDSLVEVDDIPVPIYKTLMGLLEGNYTFDYTGLMNEFSAPGDDNGREHFHFRISAARSHIRARDRAGAFSRNSTPWSSSKEASIMLNLSFSKSVSMRQQAQRALAGFCQEWVTAGTNSHLVDAIVKSIKRRLDMGNPGWLARLPDVYCKAGLYLIIELIAILGRDHIYELAEPLLTELCLGGQLPRPSNERRKEGTILSLIQKLQSSSFGPPAAVCDRQIGRWLDLAKEPGRPPISVSRCLHVALCYFRHTQKLNDQCSVNAVMRHACLSYITEDHIQFLMSLTTQLHRATENAWKILHNVGLVVSREMHFIHTHLPREGVHDHEVCPAVSFYGQQHCCVNKDENDPWIPLTGRNNHAITDCCPFMSNYLHPTASCSILYRKSYTWGKISGHTAALASTLGQAFFRPEFIRQCLEVHIALLRSAAIAGERAGRRNAPAKVQSSALAGAIEWSRFGRCALWARLADAYNHHEKGVFQGKSLGELEMDALHQLTLLWTTAINDVLPKFDATGAASPAPSNNRTLLGATPSLQAVQNAVNLPGRSPALGARNADGNVIADGLEELDEGPAVEQQRLAEEAKLAQAKKENEQAKQQQQQASSDQKVTQDGGSDTEAKKEMKKSSSSSSSASDEGETKQKKEQHVDPQNGVLVSTDAGSPLTTNINNNNNATQQISAICEFTAGNALCKGLFGAIQHLAYPFDAANENVKNTRKAIVEMVVALFRQTMFVPAVPHEAASLFLNSWGGFAGSLNHEEKIEVHKYLFAVVTQSSNIPESSNELVRRRAWQALRRSFGAPARGLWREALLLEDAFLLDQLLSKEIYDTAIEDSSRSVRAEANATFKTYLESAVVSRIASFYDYTNVPGGFPVDEELLRSDQLTHRIENTILKMRLDLLHDTTASSQKRVRAALSLIHLVTAGVALTTVLPQIPDIATTLISVPSEAASAATLTNLRRAPSDYKSISEILITLLRCVQTEVQNLRSDTASSSASSSNNNNADDSSSSVAQIMARVSPLIIYLQYLASSRFANDIGPLPGNILDITASAFYLPGRQMMQRTAVTLGTWIQVVPRADVRDFVIRTIKTLDAAAQMRDSQTMKVGIASLVAVVNAFQHTVPAFVPACLMKLVKYKSAVTLTRDEIEEQKLKQQQAEGSNEDSAVTSSSSSSSTPTTATAATPTTTTKTEDYKSIATEGLQLWWAVHLEAWEQQHKANFSESQAQAISDACKARSYFV